MTTDLLRRHGPALLVAAVAAAVYANTLANDFAFDDVWIIVENPRVHRLGDLAGIWLTPYWPRLGELVGAYRPLTVFAFAVQWALSGGAPWLFHTVNVLLHAGISILVLLLLSRLVATRAAVVGALLFAVHPVHTEAVANVVGQAELLAAAGVLSACLAYAGRGVDGRVSIARGAAVTTLYGLALLSKEHAIVLPALLVILDFAQRRVPLSFEGIARYASTIRPLMIALAGAAVAYLALRVHVLGHVTAVNAAPGLPFLREEHRLLTAFRAWPEYVRLLFFPQDLVADYSPAVILPVEAWTPMAFLGAGILAGTVVLAAATPTHPAAGFGAAWFLASILPVSNLLFPVGIVVAERTLYLPSVAVSAVLAYGWQRIEAGGTPLGLRRGAGMALAVALLLMAARTVTRNPDWKDTEAVMSALGRDHPESFRVHWHAATRAFEAGDTARSEHHWAMAYRLWPREWQLLADYALYSLRVGEYDRAARLLEASLALFRTPGTLQLLAVAYLNARRYQDALATLDRLARQTGPTAFLFNIRARAYTGLGKYREAATAWRAAIRQPGGDGWDSWRWLVSALARSGQLDAARAALDSAQARAAGDSLALRALAEVARAVGR